MATNSPQFGAGAWLFGQFIDRYATDAYGPPVSTIEQIDRAGQVGSLVCLDINFPFSDDTNVAQVKEALERNNLRASSLTPVIVSRKYTKGSFSNPDAAIRRDAVELCKQAVAAAHELGCDYVKFWPGQDGYDYPFQADYRQIWDYEIGGVREVCESDPSMQFAIEYKFKEPRVYMLFSTAARTLLSIQATGVSNLGIVLDLGHSLLAKETPADVLQLVHSHGKLVSVEMNDNWRDWDDDMTVGSVHLIETIEFIAALKKIGWDRPWLLDQFPFREDPVRAAQESIRTLRALNRLADNLDTAAISAAQSNQDALEAQRLVHTMLLKAYEDEK